MTSKDIKRAIRDHRAEMRACGIQITSCFNGGMDRNTQRANERLFALKIQLEDAVKREAQA